MNETNIQSGSTQDPNAPIIGAPNVSTTSSPITKDASSASTIKKSELEALVAMLAAGFPLLQPPGFILMDFNDAKKNNSVAAVSNAAYQHISAQVAEIKNDIINSMWDSFLKTVHELEERAKKEDLIRWTEDVNKNGPKSATEYYAYLMSVSSIQRFDELNGNQSSGLAIQFNQTFNQWMVNPTQGADAISGASQGYPSVSFVAGSLVAGSDVIRESIGSINPSLGFQLSVSPIADATFAVGPTSGLPADYQAAAALVAALLNGGAVYKSTSDTIQQAAAAGKPPQDLDFALNYAQNIMKIVTHDVESGEPMNEERVGQNQMIRLMLSTMALNMVYRAAYGGMTGKEFADILSGDTSKLAEQIKPVIEQLAAFIQSFLPKDPARRDAAITNLMAYIDSKDSVDSMLSTTRMFSSLLGTTDIDGQRVSSTTT